MQVAFGQTRFSLVRLLFVDPDRYAYSANCTLWGTFRPGPLGTPVLSGTSVWRPQSRYTVSRIECRINFPQKQRCRAKIALHPRKSRCRTFLRTPLSHFPLIRSRQGARRAGGGYRGTFGFRKRIALHNRGVSQLQSHQSRYSVQLSSCTWRPGWQVKKKNQRTMTLCVPSLLEGILVIRGQKINANFFCTKFFENPSGHGRPRRKSWTSAPKSAFSCGPGDGEKLFDPGASGRKGQECPRKIRTEKFMFILFFLP